MVAWLAGQGIATLVCGAGIVLLDCDVEEPNAHLFLKGGLCGEPETVSIPVPEVDEALCDGCGECSRFCAYKALALLAKRVLVFPEMCHGCGGCMRVCPKGAIREVPPRIGVVETIRADAVTLIQGRLDVGVAMAPPLIRAVKAKIPKEGDAILDAPPGTSCPVIATLRETDYVVLVTEPTVSGEHDLERVLKLARHFDIRTSVCVNKRDVNSEMTERIERKAEASGAQVVGRIRYDRRVTAAQIQAKAVVEIDAPSAADIRNVWEKVCPEV